MRYSQHESSGNQVALKSASTVPSLHLGSGLSPKENFLELTTRHASQTARDIKKHRQHTLCIDPAHAAMGTTIIMLALSDTRAGLLSEASISLLASRLVINAHPKSFESDLIYETNKREANMLFPSVPGVWQAPCVLAQTYTKNFTRTQSRNL
jgi:hypothetical protein